MLWRKNQRTKAPERIDSIKDLVLEALRLPPTLSERFVPDFQPCGQGSFLEAVLTKMPRLFAGIHFLPTHTADTMPLADKTQYTKPIQTAQPFSQFSCNYSCTRSIELYVVQHMSHRSLINTSDFAARDFMRLHCAQNAAVSSRRNNLTFCVDSTPRLPLFHTFPTASAC